MVAGAVGMVALAGAACPALLLNDQPATDLVEATSVNLVGSSIDLTDPAPVEAGAEEWSVLLPIENWRPISLVSEPIPADELTNADELWIGSPDDAPMGQIVEARFNPGLHSVSDYLDLPVEMDDMVAGNGTVVWVGPDPSLEALDAIVPVNGGTVALQAIGLRAAQVVELAAIIGIRDGAPIIDERQLPLGLEVLSSPSAEPGFTSALSLQRTDGLRVDVRVFPLSMWDVILGARLDGGDTTRPVGSADGVGFTYETDEGVQRAIIVADDRLYQFSEPFPGASTADVAAELDLDGAGGSGAADGGAGDSEPTIDESVDGGTSGSGGTGGAGHQLTRDDLEELMASLGQWTSEDLIDELGLQPRAEIVGGWLAETDLPDGHGLEWLATGPPLDPVAESGNTQLWMACAWVDRWEATGDPAALEALVDISARPVMGADTVDRGARADGGESTHRLDERLAVQVSAARALTTRSDRTTSELRQTCAEPLGDA
jgi:hypothetical protein